MQTFTPTELAVSDLIIDACYAGTRAGGAGDDPLPSLLGVSNQGGFRYLGKKEHPRMIALTSSMADADWPDSLDLSTGLFTYFGDNKRPGRELHDTPRFGNLLLRNIFELLHQGQREKIPPILIFTSAGQWRDVVFRGLAVPGGIGLSNNDDLVAVWRSSKGHRFQNYRAIFTILKADKISRTWLDAIQNKDAAIDYSPEAWNQWVKTGQYAPLISKRSIQIRSKKEQLPTNETDLGILQAIHQYFTSDPYAFEHCAAHIARYYLPNIVGLEVTRRHRDGGRDGIGQLRIGNDSASIHIDFALEAKCYSADSSVGVREISRLISRLRHRQFGLLITTSWVHDQAYREIVEDGHPIIILSGGDIVNIVRKAGYATKPEVLKWLEHNFAAPTFEKASQYT